MQLQVWEGAQLMREANTSPTLQAYPATRYSQGSRSYQRVCSMSASAAAWAMLQKPAKFGNARLTFRGGVLA